MPASYYMHKGRQLRRFTNQVNLYPGKDGYHCTLIVFPSTVMFDVIERGFIHRNLHDYFKCHTRKCGVFHKSVTITPKDRFIPSEQMKKMLNYLDEKLLTARWKEGQYGYEIDKLGNINRTWALDEEPETIDVPEVEGPPEDQVEHSPTS